METKRLIIQENQLVKDSQLRQIEIKLEEAGELIRNGEVVGFPTETVYGLGANALDSKACRKIFDIKGRPQDNPLIVHIASSQEAAGVTDIWPENADLCARHFWPGPLTIVLPKASIVPDVISAGLSTVAVRMPSHPIALALIRAARCPIAAPSANISGKPSPTDGEHVWRDLNGKIPLIIDGGRSQIGLESTVLDLCSETPTILRPGGITREELEQVLGLVEMTQPDEEEIIQTRPRAPGMKYRHYAPEGRIEILSETSEKAVTKINSHLADSVRTGKKTAVICMQETAQKLSAEIQRKLDFIFILGSQSNPEESAARLFEGLRLCDEKGIELIFVQGMASRGIGLAFMNRLQKASGNNQTDQELRQ